MQMLTEWLTKTQKNKRWLTRVRLGSPRSEIPRAEMSPEERAMVGSWRRWADAVILEDDKVTIVEAAIRPNPGKISQLELYAMLFPHTPELEAWRGLPLHLLLLYAIEDPATIHLARQKGIACVEYKPTWLPAYLEALLPRERRGVRF
jgi:hypothetical protein